MLQGWVKLKREILESEVIFKDSEHLAVYVFLLINACFEGGRVIEFSKEKYSLKIGELATTVREIANKCKIEQTKIIRILRLFEKCNIIATKTDKRKTLISIELSGILTSVDATKMQQTCNKVEENKDEKEKSSKREKEENKEYIKNVKPPISPKGDEEFEEFWQAYPKKVGKRYAKQCFFKLNVDNALLEKMLETLAWQKNSRDWQRENGKYIPNPSTWLNQGRWDDEDINGNGFREQKFGVYL